uniref:Ice-binding protein-4 n=1 Tax=Chlamydomonas sp. CCMP681 TaxID=413974 RepID=B1P0T0_9CHLO|nr:ice-binding protein-4 [Chlamydomonas sp. CCMP681]ABY64765.1 ice-binding protein-4 [Chlamydomonas sp. CCMP681]
MTSTDSSILTILAALMVVSLTQASAAKVTCTMNAISGRQVGGTCSVFGGQVTSFIGTGTGSFPLPGTDITYTIDANGRSMLFECASQSDILTVDSSVYSGQTINNCEPPLIEFRGCSNAAVINTKFTDITRSNAQPDNCEVSQFGPCIAVVGSVSQTEDWTFSSNETTFTTTIVSSLQPSAVSRLGGAIAVLKKDSVGAVQAVVKGTTFTTTSCDLGGAIHTAGVSLTAMDTTFTTNSAVDGGSIHFTGAADAQFVVQRCTFTTQKATANGGSIAVYGGNVTITDSDFSEGRATQGACVWLNQCASYTKDQIVNNKWTDCSTQFTTLCCPANGNVWSSCGIAGPAECSEAVPPALCPA